MIVVAVMVILMGSVFVLNFRASSAWGSERQRANRLQNFRFAAEKLTVELREASKNPGWTGLDVVVVPMQNQMSDRLSFRYYDEKDTSYRYEYYLAGDASSGYQVMRKVYTEALSAGGVPEQVTDPVIEPVTEQLTTLAAMYFVRDGNRIVMVMVARYNYGGTQQTVSYTRQVFLRGATTRP